jgi:exodeoxyribonuclease V alpha subunit
VIALVNAHMILLSRRLLYTALTRGKQLVVLVGQQRAIQLACKAGRDELRVTGLEEKLRSASEEDVPEWC